MHELAPYIVAYALGTTTFMCVPIFGLIGFAAWALDS
jgi:hypothetical protein